MKITGMSPNRARISFTASMPEEFSASWISAQTGQVPRHGCRMVRRFLCEHEVCLSVWWRMFCFASGTERGGRRSVPEDPEVF
ncbi:MAG: hypothetical protein ACK4GM_08060 [Tabrizicola sp.]